MTSTKFGTMISTGSSGLNRDRSRKSEFSLAPLFIVCGGTMLGTIVLAGMRAILAPAAVQPVIQQMPVSVPQAPQPVYVPQPYVVPIPVPTYIPAPMPAAPAVPAPTIPPTAPTEPSQPISALVTTPNNPTVVYVTMPDGHEIGIAGPSREAILNSPCYKAAISGEV